MTLSQGRSKAQAAEDVNGKIVTVNGPIAPSDLGKTLPHEHVLVDFIGADRVSRDRYDADEVFETVLPHLKRLREASCRSLFECTPAYIGRDPKLLQKVVNASGVTLITNTGYYGAAGGKFLPPHAKTESADELSARWRHEWEGGIEETGIRPGFIKIGMDAGNLSEVNRKLIQAAARTHLKSGLCIAAHTGDGVAALEQIDVLKAEEAAPNAWIWVHAQNEKNADLHVQAARQGAYVEFDGVSMPSIAQHVDLVVRMKTQELLHRVLLSQDAGWYWVGEPKGGAFRPYDLFWTEFVPALKRAGVKEDEIERMTVANPAEAFTIRVRRAT